MRKILLIGLLGCVAFGCERKDDPLSYYAPAERDSLLTDIITYVYIRPPGTTAQSRFEPAFRSYYVNHLQDFQFKKYFVSEEDVHYFYLIRPARGPQGNIRGVGGSFRLHEGKIVSFKEVFNTPIANQESLDKKGEELFNWMARHGHVKEYLKNPDYIQWPDKMTYYDTLQYEWLIKPGI